MCDFQGGNNDYEWHSSDTADYSINPALNTQKDKCSSEIRTNYNT